MGNIKYLITGLILLLVAGCDNAEVRAEFKENNRVSWKACIESGGVPIQASFNSAVLGDCVYKPCSQLGEGE